MERVSAYISEGKLREALVALWVLAGDTSLLNRWEQGRVIATMNDDIQEMTNRLLSDQFPALEELTAKPIVLIRALDTAVHMLGQNQALSILPFTLDAQEYWLLPRYLHGPKRTSLAKQTGNRSAWFIHHACLPARTAHGIDVRLYASEGVQAERLHRLMEQKSSLKIWIGHCADAADVEWDTKSSPAGNWRTLRVIPDALRRGTIRDQMDSAKACGAHIVVFPEFAVDIDQRRHLLETVRAGDHGELIYLLPGSFHENVDGKGPFNTAPLCDSTGSVLFVHEKLRLFGGTEGPAEAVNVGNCVHVMATPIGSLTVLTCKDFMDEHLSVAKLIQELQVDWVLVTSYGDAKTIKAHQDRAHELACLSPGTSSAVANSRNTAQERDGLPIPGFGHQAHQQKPVIVEATGGIVEYHLTDGSGSRVGRPTLTRIK